MSLTRPPWPSALLFDLDGTVVDSRRDIAEACNGARVAHGLPPLAFEAILGMVGDGARALVARAFGIPDDRRDEPPEVRRSRPTAGTAPGLLDAALATYSRLYLEKPAVHTVLLPGVRELLDDARAANLPCAIVTNKPHDVTVKVLEILAIAPYFSAIWGGGDGPLKPAPAGVLHVLARFEVEAKSAWMIGDGPQDVGAGKAAGVYTVGVPGIAERERLLESAPDLLVESLVELRSLLAALTADRAGPRPL